MSEKDMINNVLKRKYCGKKIWNQIGKMKK